MSIKKLTINGLRGFSKETRIEFALPDNETPGSGLTVLVGPNNSGKSTIIEAIHLLTSNHNLDIIPNSARNIKTTGKIFISMEDIVGNTKIIESTQNNGAFIQKKYNGELVDYWNNDTSTFILSSKRGFSSTFSNNNYQTRENYKGNINGSDYRAENNTNNNFGGRLLTILKNKSNRKKFDDCLEKVLYPIPNWTIESYDSNSLYLEFLFDKVSHSSNGAGDGYINIFNIIDALYDSSENNVILIDEPEISLHPDLQRKLFSLLVEYSKDKQIIVSTHSPYFVDWNLFSNKSKIFRLRKQNDSIEIYQLNDTTKKGINGIINDYQKPHTLSLNANEIFFLNDNVILTEGQDDVIAYKNIFEKYNFYPKASFFGWGAGGADRIKNILDILVDLGYKKVFTILDHDKEELINELTKKYSYYCFFAIKADDVRDKKREKGINQIINKIKTLNIDEQNKKEIIEFIDSKYKDKTGLINNFNEYKVNPKYEDNLKTLIQKITNYFNTEKIKLEEIPYNQSIDEDESDIDDKLLAENLLSSWLEENKIYEYTRKKYKKFEFNSGCGGILSFKKIKKNLYFAILEQEDGLSQKYKINVNFYIIINTKNNKVKLKNKKIISNTLPLNKIQKTINSIFK